MLHKPKLIPVGVPWQLDVATPFERLIPPEGGEHQEVQVTFVGYFGLEDAGSKMTLPTEKMIPIVQPPGDFDPSARKGTGPYRMIRMNFYGVADSCISRIIEHPSYERDSDRYDWTEVFKYREPGVSESKVWQHYWSTWRKTGLCPDPSVYQVTGSERLNQMQQWRPDSRRLDHILVWGHDWKVDVVAQRWTWEEGQTMEGWQ